MTKDKDDWQGLHEFSQNRTLYLDQFTIDGPGTPNEREGYTANCLEMVFDHFKPSVDLYIKNKKNDCVPEQFIIRSIDDFKDDSLISKSDTLEALRWDIGTREAIIFHLEKNRILLNTLCDESARNNLNEVLSTFIRELNQSQCLEDAVDRQSFQLLKILVKGIDNMDPEKMASKNIFLTDPFYETERRRLNSELELWATITTKNETELTKTIEEQNNKCNELRQILQENLFKIHDTIRQLEISYLGLEAFFNNSGKDNAGCITLMNIKKDRINDKNSDESIAVRNELERYYDRLDLKNSYSLLVIPGYLGDANKIRNWANIAHKNKILMITDFEDCMSFSDLKGELETAHLQGSDLTLSNIVMTCNYILGRKKSESANEQEDLFIPGSCALAGRMTATNEISIAQGVVGKEFGALRHVKGTRIKFLQSEIAVLINYGVIPMVDISGHTVAFSNRSLYNGSAINMQEYPIVRMFDWVKKVLMNYMHEIALETWDPYKSPQKLKERIQEFMSHYQIYQNFFSNYKLSDPVQNPATKVVTLNISITPYYSTKDFFIKLEADDKDYVNAETAVE